MSFWSALPFIADTAKSIFGNDSAGDNFSSAQAFNREEAEKNRAFQRESFQNRHQWEVQDLIKAGLNPILSAGGQPPIPSGSSAQSAPPDFGASDRRTRRLELATNSAKIASEIMLNKSLSNKAQAEAESVATRKEGTFPFTNVPLNTIGNWFNSGMNSAKDFIKRGGLGMNPKFRTR